jgi:hypothetical protein
MSLQKIVILLLGLEAVQLVDVTVGSPCVRLCARKRQPTYAQTMEAMTGMQLPVNGGNERKEAISAYPYPIAVSLASPVCMQSGQLTRHHKRKLGLPFGSAAINP